MSEKQENKNKTNNDKLLIGVIVGAVLGFLIYWSLDIVTIYSETIFIILIVVAILIAILLLLITWFRNRIIKRFFGKNVEFNSILNDTQEALKLLSENATQSLPIEDDKKHKIRMFAPKLINYILWSNFRNWGLRIFTAFVIGLAGIVSTMLVLNQNKLFENQNKLIETQNIRFEQQTHLVEADRRSAQVFIMGDVLSDVNKELNDEKNVQRVLSSPLVGRIVSLTNAMKPYRYLDGDSLVKKPLSIERGQLLISLIESSIDTFQMQLEILRKSDFSYSELKNSDFCETNLYGINLKNADMSNVNACLADFTNAKLKSILFTNGDMTHSNFSGADLTGANLKNSSLRFVTFNTAILDSVNFGGSDLRYAKFSRYTDLSKIKSLDSVIVHRKDWLIYLKDSLKLKGGKELIKKYKMDSIIDPLSSSANPVYSPMLIKKN